MLVLLSPILFSSCFLLCDTRPVIMPQEGFSYSSNMFKDVACQMSELQGNKYNESAGLMHGLRHPGLSKGRFKGNESSEQAQ